MVKRLLAGVLMLAWATPCHAAQVCAWMKESVENGNDHHLQVWMQADAHIEFLYKIGGQGVVDASGSSNSPASATYMLDPGRAESVWEGGGTLNPPGKIDVSLEVHEWPKDIFSKAPTPLLAAFKFQRNVPAGETKPPATLAKKQCAAVKAAP
ncbi:MAG TPA: hypothetical protein VMU01_00895 [Rhizomicrobium sp.]|nr:hypothetical protein [Rhizomicrobium sp.]